MVRTGGIGSPKHTSKNPGSDKRSHKRKAKDTIIYFGDECLKGILEGATEGSEAVDTSQETPFSLPRISNKAFTLLMLGETDVCVKRMYAKPVNRFKALSFQQQSYHLTVEFTYIFRPGELEPNLYWSMEFWSPRTS